ncbi:MAG: ribosome small subunit-dependent GTPase A [Vulcanimicrobiaceae bacterium]
MIDVHRALVVSTGKNAALVVLDEEQLPRVASLRRMVGKRSMPVPGDVTYVRLLEDEKVLIERVEPRASTLERRSFAGRTKTIAANVDAIVTVTALADPAPRLVTLDQLLAFAELQGTQALVVLTKPDLGDPVLSDQLTALYGTLGYSTLLINPRKGEGIDTLREAIAGRHALLCGNSGVGKSSIFRSLGGEGAVGAVSRHGLGRQTTSAARLYRMGDGFLIDSPGMNEFGLGQIAPAELTQGFREMAAAAIACRFTDCTHLREPDCGVKDAVEQGRIAASRYQSFRSILLDKALA